MANVYYLTKVTTWTQAQNIAQSMGGNLVTVNDAAENQFLVDIFGGSEWLWIGFNDAEQEGVWKWVSGEPVTYTNWGAGQPDNSGGNQDYAYINWSSPGLWDDRNNSDLAFRGIVEVKNTQPELSIGNFKVVENNPWMELPIATATFIVELSGVVNKTVTVKYATENGTAIAGKDYIVTTGTLTFEPGEKVKTIVVPVLQDNQTEFTPETFNLVLSKPNNASLDDALGKGTIVDGTYVYSLTSPTTWTEAQNIAQSMGGNLVTVNSAAENQFLVDTFGGSERLWIGFNDAQEEGVWEWVSGEPVTYTNWGAGQPDNYGGNQDYASINWSSPGLWDDESFSTTQRGIVEIVLIKGTNANNTITGTNDAEAIEGLGGNDKIIAKGGKDYLSGGTGNDNLNGGSGADIMKGDAGNDTYIVDKSGDKVTEAVNRGTDIIKASVNETLPGNVENLILTGKSKINGTGNALDNIITGNSGKNKLSGKYGNDKLNGKAGADTLIGGAGKDSFVFNFLTQGVDIITDFASGDKIRCRATGFGGGLVKGTLPSSRFVVGTKALDANDRFVYNAGSLFYDVDGSGSTAKVQLASLTGAPLLTASDIVIF